MSTEKMFAQVEERSRMESVYWAGSLILAGLIFGADSLSFLPQIGNADVWSWVFIGVGLYGTVLNLYSSALPNSVTITWDYIWSGFWLVLGLSGLFAIDIFWPLVLVLIGAAALINTFRQGK
jgi:hydrogenase/urease accessory protein HupE